MYIDLAGEWQISLEADEGKQEGRILLPGILQAAGYGNPVTRQTPWVSSLHDSFWYEQEEYRYAQEEEVNVPFLCQPPRHFLGQAVYERKFVIPGEEFAAGTDTEVWHFHVEAARWHSQVWIDGIKRGEDCTLCGPHDIMVGPLAAGEHTLKVIMDNSMLYPYRPDAHGVSDALGGTWNGLVGEIALFTEEEYQKRREERKQYARKHSRTIEDRNGVFYLDGEPFYFRGTHFGGEYPLTGYPETDQAWWDRIMRIIREWGLNSIRFHSCCPPEAAFTAADQAGICLLVECGMWNHFERGMIQNNPEVIAASNGSIINDFNYQTDSYNVNNLDTSGNDILVSKKEEMTDLLRKETRRILEYFGHHPSFVFFSSGNEPGGEWYEPLREWVRETAVYDSELGYGGRRLYTAQSGWFYDVPPSEIEGTDFIYFHRSGYGPYLGGTIRNPKGWRGGDYSPSLKGVKKPVICHELGQICAYPDYSVIEKFKGYLRPGNYKVFRENARANGILPYLKDFVVCSGENQLRLYKEELEANFRTPEIQGFELLDLHDYLGQGTAMVGILDAFWESKGYGKPEEFRNFCGDTVILARCSSYVWKNTDRPVIPVEVCHYGKENLEDAKIAWRLLEGGAIVQKGSLSVGKIARGGNTKVGSITLDFREIRKNCELKLILELEAETEKNATQWKSVTKWKTSAQWKSTAQEESAKQENILEQQAAIGCFACNSWNLHIFVADDMVILSDKEKSEDTKTLTLSKGGSVKFAETCVLPERDKIRKIETEKEWIKKGRIPAWGEPIYKEGGLLYTRDWAQAKTALEEGGRVVYSPWLSDLNYECPALSGRSVNWNSQMGPTWCRTMGIVVENSHPVFRDFPTGRSGGWQWEDILKNARGFHMEGLEHVQPIVQPIDDWNRNLLQGLLFEARVLKGKLLLVSANLEGSFEERPAACSFKKAIIGYASSREFEPEAEVQPEAIESKLFPMLRMRELTEKIIYDEHLQLKNGNAIVEADPNTSVRAEGRAFPIQIIITFRRTISVEGILYVPEQRNREHVGFVREYRVEVKDSEKGSWKKVAEGTFRNTCRSQKVLFGETLTGNAVRLTVFSAYGCVDRYAWIEQSDGWHKVFQPGAAVLHIAGIHVLCREEASHSDVYTWGSEEKSRTKEIEL